MINKAIYTTDNVFQKLILTKNIINDGEFQHCNKLINIIISENISKIGKYAFSNCINLKNVIIINKDCEIDIGAFSNCINLMHITLPNNIKILPIDVFSNCEQLQEITIPNSCLTIDINAFLRCKSLENIVIPDSVQTINHHAFAQCSNLISVTLPKNISCINSCVFDSCINLENINNLDLTVTKISDDSFVMCNKLKIKNDIFNINNKAFTNTVSKMVDETDYINICNNSTININSDNYLFSEEILSNEFSSNTNIHSIVIPNKVKKINQYAFAQCFNLTDIQLNQYITLLPDFCFYYNKNLCDINIEYIKYIGSFCFYRCINLTKIIIGKNLIKINKNAFDGCTHLKTLQNFTQTTITVIPTRCFHRCISLESITLPKTVRYINYHAFDLCVNLKTVYIPKEITYINKKAFTNVHKSFKIIYY